MAFMRSPVRFRSAPPSYVVVGKTSKLEHSYGWQASLRLSEPSSYVKTSEDKSGRVHHSFLASVHDAISLKVGSKWFMVGVSALHEVIVACGVSSENESVSL